MALALIPLACLQTSIDIIIDKNLSDLQLYYNLQQHNTNLHLNNKISIYRSL